MAWQRHSPRSVWLQLETALITAPRPFSLNSLFSQAMNTRFCETLTYDRGKDAAKHERQSEEIEAGHPRRRSI
jgi:hypothetical protein